MTVNERRQEAWVPFWASAGPGLATVPATHRWCLEAGSYLPGTKAVTLLWVVVRWYKVQAVSGSSGCPAEALHVTLSVEGL